MSPPFNGAPTAERWETPDAHQIERWGDGSIWIVWPDGSQRLPLQALTELWDEAQRTEREPRLVRCPIGFWNHMMDDLAALYRSTEEAGIFPRGDVAALIKHHIEKNRVPDPDEVVDLTGITWGKPITSSIAALRRAGQRWMLARAFYYATVNGRLNGHKGGLTDEEAAARCDITRGAPWKRCTDLRQGGWLRWTGATRETRNGAQAKVWAMTQSGIREWERLAAEAGVRPAEFGRPEETHA